MKKLILMFILLFPLPSFADWTEVVENDLGNLFYVDFDRIRKHDGYIYYWVLTDLLKPRQGNMSFSIYHQGDCKLFRYKPLSFSYYKQPMGRGPAVVQEPGKELQSWIYPLPDSAGESILKSVCSN